MALITKFTNDVASPNQAVMNILGHKKVSNKSASQGLSKITGFSAIAGFQMPPDDSVNAGGRNNFLISAAGYFLS